MANFCKECSIEVFGEDFGDFAGITKKEDLTNGLCATVLCEGCGGMIGVDTEGKRIGPQPKYHRKKKKGGASAV